MCFESDTFIRIKYSTFDVFGNYLGVDTTKLNPKKSDVRAALNLLGNGAVYFDFVVPVDAQHATIYRFSINLITYFYSIEKKDYDAVDGFAKPDWCKRDLSLNDVSDFAFNLVEV